jgi:hypothetical protein
MPLLNFKSHILANGLKADSDDRMVSMNLITEAVFVHAIATTSRIQASVGIRTSRPFQTGRQVSIAAITLRRSRLRYRRKRMELNPKVKVLAEQRQISRGFDART